MTDIELIDQIKNGDQSAFTELYTRHNKRVTDIAFRISYNYQQDNIDDLVQEVWMQVYRKLHTFKGQALFSTWLHTVAVNTMNMHYRKKFNVRAKLSIDVLEHPDHYKHLIYRDRVTEGSYDRMRLWAEIEALAPGYRRKYILHEIAGMEHHEIAKMEGCSIGNSKSQVSKARQLLKQKLTQSV